ncbi:MAG: hypothetical protein M3291_02540 [Actinomycetota bacterium]|nr:hypothetical protein [Actinomycetota bacterium]
MVADAIATHLVEFPAGEDGLLFHTRTGVPLRHDYYGDRVFAKAVERAGLPKGTGHARPAAPFRERAPGGR